MPLPLPALFAPVPNEPALTTAYRRGPELVSFGRSGHITPNHQLFGGDTHLNIDARHSTDPAATAAAVHRVLQPYLPHIAAMAATANNERNARRPPSARR